MERRILLSGQSEGITLRPLAHANAVFAPLLSLPVPSEPAVVVSAATPFLTNLAVLETKLLQAPMEFSAAAASSPVLLKLPRPDGQIGRFRVVEAPVMAPKLAAQFPQIRTYRGQGVDDPTASVRLDITPLGFHAQVLSANGSYCIDPYRLNDASGAYVSYFKRNAQAPGSWNCRDLESTSLASSVDALPTGAVAPAIAYGSTLRTFRAAVAADGEYVAAVGGGTVAGGLAAVVTAINRVTGVYEAELDVRLVLVDNESSLIYTNPRNDPYSNDKASQLLSQNQKNIDSVIGDANYDIGHVFTTGGGGLAYLGVVGQSGLKARGETGLSNPTGDAFYIDYVAHEMGHQFGANHTFNTSADASNRNASTAYEPGSGSTIMAYAGIEGTEDLQPHSDPYFHSASIDEIQTYLGTIPTVGTSTPTGNQAPTVSAGPSYTIPARTPFALTATGSDPDGDPITYDWQERDLGPAVLLTTPDNGSSPILRDWAPTTDPTRTFPRLSDLVNNTLAPGEKLPTVARSNFAWRVIARDNRPGGGGGGVATSDVSLVVVDTGAAFALTSPNTAVTFTGGSTQTITWNVAGTNANGINTADVRILLSTDGGYTYPTILSPSTANDGSDVLTIPNINTSTARIRVEAIGNLFFDISDANFTITAATPPTVISSTIDDGTAQRSMLRSLTITFSESVQLLTGGIDILTRAGAPLTDIATSLATSDQTTWQITFTGPAVTGGSLPDGTYTLLISATQVHNLSGTALTADYTRRFYRLFGDADGNRVANTADLTLFRQVLSGALPYNSILDYDANGSVDTTDYRQIRSRLTLPMP